MTEQKKPENAALMPRREALKLLAAAPIAMALIPHIAHTTLLPPTERPRVKDLELFFGGRKKMGGMKAEG